MSLNKKLLAGAIVGVLFSASVNAADLTAATPTPDKYALELVNGTSVTNASIVSKLNYNFSSGEVRYVRLSCDNVDITAVGAIVVAPANYSVGTLNGVGTNTLFFSITATGAGPWSANDVMTFPLTVKLKNKNDVKCETALYDLPSQAQNGGAAGLVINSGSKGMQTFITRPSGVVFKPTPSTATADVEANTGAYTKFVGNSNTGTIGALQFAQAAGVWKADSTQVTLDDIFTTDTEVQIKGDYSAATAFTWAGNNADTAFPANASKTALVWTYGNANLPLAGQTGNVVYTAGTTKQIQVSEYTAILVGDTETGYEFTDATVKVGDIVRNGTQLQAPLVQLPTGWLSRVALTNTGSVARPYEISAMGETGVTGTFAHKTGTIPANGTIVIDLPGELSFNTGNRGTVNVNVSAPNSQIQGLYQIVNPDKGSISNHVMVRPGTN